MFSREDIKKAAGYSYSKGVELYNQNKVHSFSYDEKGRYDLIEGWVKGSSRNLYSVSINVDREKGKLEDCDCECKAFLNYGGLCKHCVAVLLAYIAQKNQKQAILEYLESLRGNYAEKNKSSSLGMTYMGSTQTAPAVRRRETSEEMKELMGRQAKRQAMPLLKSDTFGKVRLEPCLTMDENTRLVEFRIGVNKMYVLKDILAFAEAVRQVQEVSYGKNFSFLHVPEMFDVHSRKMVSFLVDWSSEYERRIKKDTIGGRTYANRAKLRNMPLDAQAAEQFLEAVGEQPFLANIAGKGEQIWQIVSDPFRRKLFVKGVSDGMEVGLEDVVCLQGIRYDFCFKNNKIYRIPAKEQAEASEFVNCLERMPAKRAFFQKEDITSFFRQMLPALKGCMDCRVTGLQAYEYSVEPAEFRFYLDMPQNGLVTCLPKVFYGDASYSVYDTETDLEMRDLYQEREVAREVSSFCNAFDEQLKAMVISDDSELLYVFLTEGTERLGKLGQVYISEALKKIRILPAPRVSAGISLSGDLLELSLGAEGMSREQLAEILSRYDRKKKYYRLKDGSLLKAEDEQMAYLADLTSGLQLTAQELLQERLTLPKYRALFVNEQLSDKEGISFTAGDDFRKLVQNMKLVEESTFTIPESLEGTMREYQKYGYRWICTLQKNGFGGILADDMGLGKTLQVICFLTNVFAEDGDFQDDTSGLRRCLIVCPASLVYNWKSELERFAPHLPVRMITGTAAERENLLRNLQDREIVITSYDLLRRDLEYYEDCRFFVQIIDEAQYIKNHGTQAARAVKMIQAGFKLALTGTPVENRLSELWSIFDYMMPGYLYAYPRFREEIEVPIIQQEDERTAQRLQKMIRPFVLRRLKQEVLKDLPEKMEENLYARMEGEQKQLYDAHAERMRIMLDQEDDAVFAKSKLQILAELTRLRQICCDPGLLFEQYAGGSAKLDMAVQLICDAVANGHKVLLFSQFTTMLERLTESLSRENITWHLLTGATAKEKRAEMVESFQYDDVPVFCISLKAGGTGLNLTAADVVVHFDPWWNVAVQNQATDRAHRIGQKNTVNVYRLIAKDSIEEKIISLQERKRELADRILGGEGFDSTGFTREELLELLK